MSSSTPHSVCLLHALCALAAHVAQDAGAAHGNVAVAILGQLAAVDLGVRRDEQLARGVLDPLAHGHKAAPARLLLDRCTCTQKTKRL